MKLVIAAVADIHCPKYFDLFKSALEKICTPDLFLLLGDTVLKNDYTQLSSVISAIRNCYENKIIACFGNEEYESSLMEYKKFEEITWLSDESTVLDIKGKKLGIVGSRGSLDRPTFWQRTRVRGIGQTYKHRIDIINSLLADLNADIKIVISHYAPTYRTLVGEREFLWPEMASKRLESIIETMQPNLWLHGHIHRGSVPNATLGNTVIMNVSLPSTKKITMIEL
jgi:Icc-related predicted phosphoesterase